MPLPSSPEFLRRVAERTGLSAPDAGSATEATLRALGRQLRAARASELADELPPTLGEWVAGTEHGGHRGLAPLLARVAVGEGCPASFAAEHAAVVCQVLAEALRPAALRALSEALPDDVAALLEPRAAIAPVAPPRLDPTHRTLAEADSASEHPLYRSRPPDRAHAESVARADNPHGDTKLSSASGLTQEREGESLASARPHRRG